jgi:ADP-sugar diphosphatase
MVDSESNFHSVALKELKEECGIDIQAHEMVALGSGEYAVSPGGSDESLGLFLVEKTVSQQDLQDLEGRFGGLREEGERIKVKLVKLSQVVKKTRSLSVLAAIALYNARH